MTLRGTDAAVADMLIGVDTLWGGDVRNPSGTGRFIADCWFSDEPLPKAYTHARPPRCGRMVERARSHPTRVPSMRISPKSTSAAPSHAYSPIHDQSGTWRALTSRDSACAAK